MSEPASPETVLCTAYAREIDCYAQALEVTRHLVPALHGGADGKDGLQQLSAHLDEVAAIERRIAETKRRWKLAGQKPGPQLQALLARLADLIQELTGHVQQAEQLAQVHRDRLLPQLDAANRGRQMQRAYGRQP